MKHYTRLSLSACMLATLSIKAMEQDVLPVSKAFAELTIIDPTKNQPKTLAETCLGYFGINNLQDKNNLKKIMYGYTHFQRPVRVPSHLAVLIIEKFTNNFIEKVAPQVAAELFITNLADETKIAIIKRIGQSAKVDECRGIFQQLMNDPKTGNKIKQCIKECIDNPLFQPMKAFLIAQIYAQKLPERQKLIERQLVHNSAFSPDGQYHIMLHGSSIKISAIKNNQWLRHTTLTGHAHSITSALWSPDSKYLATSSDANTVKIWTIKDNQWLCHVTLIGHTDYIDSVSWSPDGKYLATASWDKTAKIWTVDGQCIATLTGYTSYRNSVSWSSDGTYLIIGSSVWNTVWGKGIKIWDMRPLDTITQHPFSCDEMLLVKAIVNAQDNCLIYQLNKHEQQIFNQLGNTDKELGRALRKVLKPFVKKHRLITQFINTLIKN